MKKLLSVLTAFVLSLTSTTMIKAHAETIDQPNNDSTKIDTSA